MDTSWARFSVSAAQQSTKRWLGIQVSVSLPPSHPVPSITSPHSLFSTGFFFFHRSDAKFCAAVVLSSIHSCSATEGIARSFPPLSGDKILTFQTKHIMINQMSFVSLVHLGVYTRGMCQCGLCSCFRDKCNLSQYVWIRRLEPMEERREKMPFK